MRDVSCWTPRFANILNAALGLPVLLHRDCRYCLLYEWRELRESRHHSLLLSSLHRHGQPGHDIDMAPSARRTQITTRRVAQSKPTGVLAAPNSLWAAEMRQGWKLPLRQLSAAGTTSGLKLLTSWIRASRTIPGHTLALPGSDANGSCLGTRISSFPVTPAVLDTNDKGFGIPCCDPNVS
jgi:hypothetical protein